MAFRWGEEPERFPLLLRKSVLFVSVKGDRASSRRRKLSTAKTGDEFFARNAYDVLGVSESSSFAEIKASFRKLAKETHPDVSPSPDPQHFLQILAAYEILSDSKTRAHYDSYLLFQRKILQKQQGLGSAMYTYSSSVSMMKQIEVVDWLKWYRLAIKDIVQQRKVVAGSGYLDKLESELYTAIHAAYYGPLIESMDLLPECFEAEERSAYETPEVLHLVSGRDLFGIIYVMNKVPQLSHVHFEKLSSFSSMGIGIFQYARETIMQMSFGSWENVYNEMQVRENNDYVSDVYKDLELHISGRVVATASRSPPKRQCNEISTVDSEDHIRVFLSLNKDHVYSSEAVSPGSSSPSSLGSRILLGTITGLGTGREEGSCFVYGRSGTKTHVLMKHRTLLVKHLHWYQYGDEVSACECRCSRARLPPSKFWLFEPRCHMHDIGGWYVETFGRDKRGRTVPSQRQWDNAIEHLEKRLHPAMYLLALAYRTLDLEDAKRRKRTVRHIIEPKLSSIFRWCKKRF